MTRDEICRLLSQKIIKKTAVVGIIGIGTIGEILGRSIAAAGFQTIGFDIDATKIAQLNKRTIPRFSATAKFSSIATCDIIIICVPTPVTDKKRPDLRCVNQAVADILGNAGDHHVVIIESSVSVGTTRTIAARLEGRKNTQWFIGYCPERIDPGNKKYTLVNTPKIISGIERESVRLVKLFYSSFVNKLVVAESPEAAELAKLFENTFRLVNISLVHELASFAHRSGLDIRHVIGLAATKPFGFLAHYPSIGIGGHCIPVDPYYLLVAARKKKVLLPIVESALLRNEKRPADIARYIATLIPTKKSKKQILLIGITYKKNVADIRESAAIRLWTCLEKNGWQVTFHDPLIPTVGAQKSVQLVQKLLQRMDAIVLTTNHDAINYSALKKLTIPIVDTTGQLQNIQRSNIFQI